MSPHSLGRFALRLVGTACITLWMLEATSNATKCDWDFIGEIWELEQTEAPHLSTGELVDGEQSKWGGAGTLEGISSEEVRIDGVLAQEIDLEATRFTLVRAADRMLCGAVLLLFCRGCCLEERVYKSVVATGFYRMPEGVMAPLQGLTMFVDGTNDTVRFEYAHEAGTVLVEYEATSRRFTEDG